MMFVMEYLLGGACCGIFVMKYLSSAVSHEYIYICIKF